MITLYLDHQIYTYLKNKDIERYFSDSKYPKKQEHIRKLEAVLHQNKNNFLIFCSSAHLSDLSNDTSPNKERLYADLDYRKIWAGNNYLYYSNKEKTSKYQLIDIVDAFEQLLEWKNIPIATDYNDLFNIEKHKDFLTDEEFEKQKHALEILKQTPAPTWESLGITDNNSDALNEFRNVFPFFNGSGNMLDFFSDASKFFQQFEADPAIYKNLRSIVKKGIETVKDANELTDESDTTKFIVDIAKLDLTTVEKEQFVKDRLLDVVKKQLANQDNLTPTPYDLHTQSYFSLDIMNIEVEKNVKTRNMLNDGQHSFFGGHCEVVISDDRMFREKSKLIYKLFGLSTEVYSIDEFLQQSVLLKLNNASHPEDFYERLVFDVKNSIISSSIQRSASTHIKSSNLNSKYFHYFNKMLLVEQYEKTYLILRHEENTYLNSLPYKILEQVVNKAYETFGIDFYGKSTYKSQTENDEIEDENWPGRNWKYNNLSVSLEYNYSRKCLQLVYGPIY